MNGIMSLLAPIWLLSDVSVTQLNSLLFPQTRQEYQVLQGSIINAQYVKRGKTISSRKLRYHALTVDASAVDYRSMGFVTEVKDQVGNTSIPPEVAKIQTTTNIVCRATAVPAGPSAPREPLRVSCTRRQVSSYP